MPSASATNIAGIFYRIVRHTKQSGGQITGFSAKPEEMASAIAPPPVVNVEAKRVEPMPLPPPPEPEQERPHTPVFEFKSKPTNRISDRADRWTNWLAVCAGVIACLILGLMAYRVGGNRSSAQKSGSKFAAPQAQNDLGPAPHRRSRHSRTIEADALNHKIHSVGCICNRFAASDGHLPPASPKAKLRRVRQRRLAIRNPAPRRSRCLR